MKRKLTTILFFVVAIAVIFIFGSIYRRHQLLYHYRPVTPKVLYRSGILSYQGLNKAHELSYFKTIIDLSADNKARDTKNDWYQSELKFSDDKHIQLINMFIPPGSIPTPAQISKFLSIMGDKQNYPVLVHCSQGVMRTNTMVAVYEIAMLKKSNKEVLAHLPMFGHTWERHEKERHFILTYRPRA